MFDIRDTHHPKKTIIEHKKSTPYFLTNIERGMKKFIDSHLM